ncbi:ABC transporter substrate-binding protein [Kineosporia babensis]|uniref:ABC transporter substrate-binding protein n=1 Tax=Kineosporia babensis TaxID=499548 RepID=A0A9X1NBP8_9ACTN|nr:ABC transporter substrate-binding protein [Kineosporia babensis]MCD5310740.1 ABC transporter substrate-binding protein [Kineosporia babensis]
MRSRTLLRAGAFFGAAALLAACSGGSSSSEGGSARDEALVIAENEPPASFDPVQADNSTVDEVVIPAYDSLLTYGDDGELAGVLASEWKVADDGLGVTLTLRDDVTFHDGAKLTATDVKYTLDRIKSLNIGVASFLTSYDSSEAVSDTELQITLSTPDAVFLPALTRVYVLNSALVEQNAGSDQGQSWLATNDAGSGPYQLTGYRANQSADYEQYADYWQGFTGQAKSVQFQYISDASTQKSALESGDVDVAMDIAPTDWSAFEGQDGFAVDKADTNVVLYTFFNMDDATTKNVALREAIASSYNYQEHIDQILLGAGKAVTGPLPSGMQCATAEVTQPAYDLDKAKQIVADNNLDGTSVTMTYLEATAEMEQAATLLQSNLAEIGITLDLQAVTYPQYVEMNSSPETRPQLGMIYAFPAFPDASAIMYQNFNSKMIGSQNWGGYSNAEVDKLTDAAQTESDQAQRCADYEEAQSIASAEYPSINMANAQTVAIMNERVQDFTYRSWHHQTVNVYAIQVS